MKFFELPDTYKRGVLDVEIMRQHTLEIMYR